MLNVALSQPKVLSANNFFGTTEKSLLHFAFGWLPQKRKKMFLFKKRTMLSELASSVSIISAHSQIRLALCVMTSFHSLCDPEWPGSFWYTPESIVLSSYWLHWLPKHWSGLDASPHCVRLRVRVNMPVLPTTSGHPHRYSKAAQCSIPFLGSWWLGHLYVVPSSPMSCR